jgi:hypothetical protein
LGPGEPGRVPAAGLPGRTGLRPPSEKQPDLLDRLDQGPGCLSRSRVIRKGFRSALPGLVGVEKPLRRLPAGFLTLSVQPEVLGGGGAGADACARQAVIAGREVSGVAGDFGTNDADPFVHDDRVPPPSSDRADVRADTPAPGAGLSVRARAGGSPPGKRSVPSVQELS